MRWPTARLGRLAERMKSLSWPWAAVLISAFAMLAFAATVIPAEILRDSGEQSEPGTNKENSNETSCPQVWAKVKDRLNVQARLLEEVAKEIAITSPGEWRNSQEAMRQILELAAIALKQDLAMLTIGCLDISAAN